MPHGRDSSHRLVGPTPVTMFPQRHPTREPTVTNVEFFESELRNTLELPSSNDEKRAISSIGVQGLLWTTQRRGALATCLMR